MYIHEILLSHHYAIIKLNLSKKYGSPPPYKHLCVTLLHVTNANTSFAKHDQLIID